MSYLIAQVPEFLFNLMKHLPTKSLKKMNSHMVVATSVAQEVVDKQTSLYAHGKEGSKDLMSILGMISFSFLEKNFILFLSYCLVRANLSENPKTKLSNDEVLAQLTYIFFHP